MPPFSFYLRVLGIKFHGVHTDENSNLLHFLADLLKKRLTSMRVFQLFVPPKLLSLILHKMLTENNCLLTVIPEALLLKIHILTECFIMMNRPLEKTVKGIVCIQPV